MLKLPLSTIYDAIHFPVTGPQRLLDDGDADGKTFVHLRQRGRVPWTLDGEKKIAKPGANVINKSMLSTLIGCNEYHDYFNQSEYFTNSVTRLGYF